MTNGLVWLRRELRLHDNPLLQAATQCDRLLLVYVIDAHWQTQSDWGWPRLHAHRWRFLAEALRDLQQRLAQHNQHLLVVQGDAPPLIADLVREHGIERVYVNAAPGSEEAGQVSALQQLLGADAALTVTADNRLFHEMPFASDRWPMSFSAFRRKVEKRLQPLAPLAGIKSLPQPLLDNYPDWPEILQRAWSKPPRFSGGESAGLQRLQHYLYDAQCILDYKQTRNGMLQTDDSSKLSPWLANGCLSVRHVWAEIERFESEVAANDSTYWLKFELLWREYSRWLLPATGSRLFHFSGLRDRAISNMQAFSHFTRQQQQQFAAWTRGDTGIPMIDANMRELHATGYMSNRGRQNVASFLVNDLQLDWRAGAAWFEHLLVDYDVASNWGNWAYQAGVGTDTRERWFNVVEQSRRYDPQAEYISHWCPELADLPLAQRFAPWTAATPPADFPVPMLVDARW